MFQRFHGKVKLCSVGLRIHSLLSESRTKSASHKLRCDALISTFTEEMNHGRRPRGKRSWSTQDS
jgi:hypothetical protein